MGYSPHPKVLQKPNPTQPTGLLSGPGHGWHFHRPTLLPLLSKKKEHDTNAGGSSVICTRPAQLVLLIYNIYRWQQCVSWHSLLHTVCIWQYVLGVESEKRLGACPRPHAQDIQCVQIDQICQQFSTPRERSQH